MIDPHTFLQKCVDKGYAKDIVVEYNSNPTNILNGLGIFGNTLEK